MTAALAIDGVSHAFGGLPVVRRLSLEIAPGEIVCLLGPSGCGKTTTLRLVAGLEAVQSGRIAIHGHEVASPARHVPPERRNVGLVFQDFALFPHLRVAENVAFGLKGGAGERRAKALAMLERVGLARYAEAYPHVLSGGEQQRVALVRALAPEPGLMLMDEPFSGLDVRLRDQVREATLALLAGSATGTLLVTHDPEEAMRVGNRIGLMRRGRLVQIGTAEDLYDRPADIFAARFFGEINQFRTRIEGAGAATPWGSLPVGKGAGAGSGAAVEVLVRPEAVLVGAAGPLPRARVLESRVLGPSCLYKLAVPAMPAPWLARTARHVVAPAGAEVSVGLDPTHVHCFLAEAEDLQA